jgi:hypothetical protein
VIVAGDDSTLIIQCIGTIDETPNYLKSWNVWVNWRIQADYPRSIINHLGDASMSGKIFGPRQRGGRCNRKRVQLRFEAMESRVLLATTFLVTNTNDDGAGSLRQVILDANPAAQPPHDRFSDRNGRPSDDLSAVSPAGDHQLRDHRRYLPAGLYGLPAN